VIVSVLALAFGAVDYLWQRAEHLRLQRMSRKELLDETKETEGDPFIASSVASADTTSRPTG
jgi:flagellar biosynthesis protein FlhB